MIHQFKTLNSTQDTARELIESQQAQIGDVVSCHEQTAGRGRANNSWQSQDGLSLTCTFIAPPITSNMPPLSLMVGALLADKFNDLIKEHNLHTYQANNSQPIQIKWPNDLFHQDKKLGGILIDNKNHYSLIGIGINVKNSSRLIEQGFASLESSYQHENAASIEPTVESILEQTIVALEPIISGSYNNTHLDQIWSNHCYLYLKSNQLYLNELVSLESGKETLIGIIRGISIQGYLLLEPRESPIAKANNKPSILSISQASNIRLVTL